MIHPICTIFLQSSMWKVAVEKAPISINIVLTKQIVITIWMAYKKVEKSEVK